MTSRCYTVSTGRAAGAVAHSGGTASAEVADHMSRGLRDVNTLHFRLRRIADLLGGNWPHGEHRFGVELALRLTDLLDIRARQQAREHHAPSSRARIG
jgi:hypothetical protein